MLLFGAGAPSVSIPVPLESAGWSTQQQQHAAADGYEGGRVGQVGVPNISHFTPKHMQLTFVGICSDQSYVHIPPILRKKDQNLHEA